MNDASSPGQWTTAVLGGALFAGIVARLAPVFMGPDRLFKHWPTEDGYLTLTIARNMARGFGMSVADGTVPTNGTQPLGTTLYSIGFWLTGGSREGGVIGALIMQTVIAAVAAWLMFRLGRDYFGRNGQSKLPAAVGAAVWFLGPVTLPHTTNCLETGLYGLCILLSLSFWSRWISSRSPDRDLRRALVLGALLGLTHWARVDGVFVTGALCAAHVLPALLSKRWQRFKVLLQEAVVCGLVSVVVIAPWLILGKVRFGYWTPISGVSEGAGAHFGGNFPQVGANLAEYVVGLVGVPMTVEKLPLVAVVCWLVCIAWAVAAVQYLRSASPVARQLCTFAAILALPLVGYYGLLFGAPYFVSRYFFPLSLVAIPLTAQMVASALRSSGRSLQWAAALVAVALLAGQQVRQFRKGESHLHWQVVTWVSKHVPDGVWVGAVQTGTLGFFHDRTFNLDGKVDPNALREMLRGKIPEYVVASPIQVLVDWNAMRVWKDIPVISSNFDLVVDSSEENLAAFIRKGSPLRDSVGNIPSSGAAD